MPTSSKRKSASPRARDIQLIKIGQQQLGLDDAAYRDMLQALTGRRSATELDDAQRARVLEHMVASGAKLKWSKRRNRTIAEERQPLVAKIRVLLMHLGNRSDSYADGIARRMYRCDRYEWLLPSQLRGIVVALTKELERLRAKAAQEAQG